jgi:hypothetical protein
MSGADPTIQGFNAEAGKKYRVLMPYSKERHILLHLQVTKDASLYLFDLPFDPPIAKVSYGRSRIEQGSTQTVVDITQGEVMNHPKGAHLSFHGSGVVNTGTGRAIGHQLRRLTNAGVVCSVIFPHPSKLPVARGLRQSDITVHYPIDEGCPLALNICAAPRGNFPSMNWLNIPEAAFQWTYAFLYERLLEEDDLLLILVFYHSPGEWMSGRGVTWWPMDVRQLEPDKP